MYAMGGAHIDLHTETMKMVLQPKPKKGLRGMTSAVRSNWVFVSIKSDFKTVFAFEISLLTLWNFEVLLLYILRTST